MKSLIVLLFLAAPALAGLHAPSEIRNPLPAKWRGFLPDQRLLRMAAVDPATSPNLPPSPLRDRFLDRILTLDGRAKTADQVADLSDAFIRLGRTEQAIGLLRTARRQFPDDFHLAANLGTAYQLSGDLDSAILALTDAVTLAPEKLKPSEAIHLKLVQLRKVEGKKPADRPDDIVNLAKLAKADPALVQQLALTLPADGRLLWLLGEIAFVTGDVRMAANILDGCVSEFGMNSPRLREQRKKFRTAAELLAEKEDHTGHQGTIEFASARPLGSLFDASLMPKIQADRPNPLPWLAILETTVAKGFKPQFVKYVDSLDGKTVTMLGYPTSSGDDAEGTAFLMTEFPIGCWFCESPEPVAIVKVELADTVEPGVIGKSIVKVTGTLQLNRHDPEKFLYTLSKAKLTKADD